MAFVICNMARVGSLLHKIQHNVLNPDLKVMKPMQKSCWSMSKLSFGIIFQQREVIGKGLYSTHAKNILPVILSSVKHLHDSQLCVAEQLSKVAPLHVYFQVKKDDLVYDPFVGTGSILVAAAHLGACTIGADIDMRVVRDGKLGSDGQVG